MKQRPSSKAALAGVRAALIPAPPRHWRPTWIEVSLAALEQNYLKLKSFLVSSNTQIMAVVKANSYGMGAAALGRRLEELGVGWMGVSSIDEGAALREAGVGKARILVLGSAYPFCESFEASLAHNLTLSLASAEAARELGRFMAGRTERIRTQLKMETGMQRIGAQPQTCAEIFKILAGESNIKVEGVYTHFAKARDEKDVLGQLDQFDRGCALLAQAGGNEVLRHAANSAAAIRFPQSHLDMIRPGLALYGCSPGFEPIAAFKTRIVYIKKLDAGVSVSYERFFTTLRPTVLATIPVGYADGLPIAAWSRAHVLVRGRKAPLAGLITMDMTMIDITDIPGAGVGDPVTVIGNDGGEQIRPQDWALWGKQSVYQLLCNLGTPRLPKVYIE